MISNAAKNLQFKCYCESFWHTKTFVMKMFHLGKSRIFSIMAPYQAKLRKLGSRKDGMYLLKYMYRVLTIYSFPLMFICTCSLPTFYIYEGELPVFTKFFTRSCGGYLKALTASSPLILSFHPPATSHAF